MLEEFKSNDSRYKGDPIWLENAEIGVEYWVCDPVVGRIDESLVAVTGFSDGKVLCVDVNTGDCLHLDGGGMVAHRNRYDKTFRDGVRWLDSL